MIFSYRKKHRTNGNRETYESKDIVEYYLSSTRLQYPERTILDMVKGELPQMKMLDIGVGTGRTTLHFAGLTKEYIGIDYSEAMIKVCKQRFIEMENARFEVCDVRSLIPFKNKEFDCILFSFNGIDYISHEERLSALTEIKRVSKDGAYFVFSSHNLLGIDKIFKIRLYRNPFIMAKEVFFRLSIRMLNKSAKKLESFEYAVINDGANQFRLKTYFIKPMYQVKQLKNLGFKNIRVFSYDTGAEIQDRAKLYTITDRWLYYLCNA